MAFITEEAAAEFNSLAAKLERRPEEMPELGLALLRWYVERREQGL